MRIIAGRFKGHPLVAFKASHIRPTTDRVKETIFNKLMGQLLEANVWDLYAGTGNLGLEALSRGAGHVTFVESHRKSLQILQQNVTKLQVEDEVTVRKSDVFQFLKSASCEPSPDIVFVDPPFTRELAHSSMQALQDVGLKDCKIIIESKKQERIDDVYGMFQLLDRTAFGDKTLSIFHTKDEME